MELRLRLTEAAYQETIATDMHGFLSKPAWLTNTGISRLLMPLSLLNPFTTFILGLIGTVTFTIALVPFSAIWVIMFGWLWGTSWLWLKAPILRPLLFLPGVLSAPLCARYVGWIPAYGDLEHRLLKINACASWPLTAALWRRVLSR
ncbi:MAG: hypothetical protein V1724_09475 [Chloroflexota bacterium]